MKKEDRKKRISQNEDQGEVSKNSDAGFVYDFFISEDEDKNEPKTAFPTKKPPAENPQKRLKQKDQSEAFFLPDIDIHDD
jgi:hypothetical protein